MLCLSVVGAPGLNQALATTRCLAAGWCLQKCSTLCICWEVDSPHHSETIIAPLACAGGDCWPLHMVRDVEPDGATTAYASPEQLLSLQLQYADSGDEEEDLLINGPLSDMFSAGVVLFELLTGELPFEPTEEQEEETEGLAPESVPEEYKETWEEYEAMRRLHNDWVSFCCWRSSKHVC